ncbi:MAG: DsrE family protein [Candidatus Bathyarchaeota archaeon]|nr:DsrE family protein [Candidatus Bathyarchaeota archaeon]
MIFTIIINDAPYGIEKPWNALRLASTSAGDEIGMTVRVFLMGDSVVSAKKGQKTPEGYYNMEKMLQSLVSRGVEVKTCGACIDARGIKETDLVEGVQRGSMKILATWIKESDKAVSF